METTVDFLNAAKRALGVESDYALTSALKWSHSKISNYRAGRSRMDEVEAAQIAAVLGLPVGYVLACVAAERTKRPEIKRAWHDLAKAVAPALVFLFLSAAALPYAVVAAGQCILCKIRRVLAVAGIFGALALTGCADEPIRFFYTSGDPRIEKFGRFQIDPSENTPVIWNGRPVLVAGHRPCCADALIIVYDIETKAELARHATPGMTLIGAVVAGGALYVFGVDTLDQRVGLASNGNSVLRTVTHDLTHWSPLEVVYTAPGDQSLYNLSITEAPGGWVMAADFSGRGALGLWSTQFLYTPDLSHFFPVGGYYTHPNDYNAGAMITHKDGFFYLFYHTNQFSPFYIAVARSADLDTWETQRAPHAVLYPTDGEGINASDVDLLDVGGNVLFFYVIGNQGDWSEMHWARFSGSFAELVAPYF